MNILRLKLAGIPKPIIILIAGGFIQSLGNSLLWPLNSLFMHDVLGRSLTEAGFILALQSGVSLLGQFWSGVLSDRFLPKKIMLGGIVTAILFLVLIALFPVWTVYAPAFILFGLAQAFILVPLNALVHAAWPEGGRRGYNLLYVFNNAGVAIGTAIGGAVAAVSFRLTFLINAFSFTLFFLLVWKGISGYHTRINLYSNQSQAVKLTKERSFPILTALSAGIFLVWSAYIQWTTILPVEMSNLGFPLPAYSILWTLNGVFIVMLQPLTARIIRVWAKGFTRQFYLASVLISLSFVILLARLPYFSYILAMLILTIGEMLILPAVPAAAAQLAPSGRDGVYQGIVGGAGSGGRMLGPLLGGIAFDHGGGSAAWYLALIFTALSLAVFSLYQRLARKLSILSK